MWFEAARTCAVWEVVLSVLKTSSVAEYLDRRAGSSGRNCTFGVLPQVRTSGVPRQNLVQPIDCPLGPG